jgi:hypothetical protein
MNLSPPKAYIFNKGVKRGGDMLKNKKLKKKIFFFINIGRG